MRKKIVTALMIIALVSAILLATPQQVNSSKFILAGWDYPDDYGQGITTWYAQSNATGSWVTYESEGYLDASVGVFDWNVSQAMKIAIWCTMNQTLQGFNDSTTGMNYIRHNISVTVQNGTEIWSQQNFTFDAGQSYYYNGIWYYRYYVILGFLPVAAEYYTVEIVYEIYW